MNDASYRGAPIAAGLAIGGALLALVLLVMPWYSIDPDGVQWVLANAPLDQTPSQYAAAHPADPTIALLVQGLQHRGQGLKVEPPMWIWLRIGAALLAIVAAGLLLRTRQSGSLQRFAFLVSGVVFAASPVMYLTTQRGPKFTAVHSLAPAVYASFVAAALMLAALAVAGRLAAADRGPELVPALQTGLAGR